MQSTSSKTTQTIAQLHSVCGIDEAGRGPAMGPLVVAGVKVHDDSILAALNVRDSKKCTPNQREKLAEEIRKIAECKVIIISADEIDNARKTMTLNKLEADAFAKIIGDMKPYSVYVDAADSNELNFKNAILANVSFPIELTSTHYADELFPVVSAASIIAKTVRDAEIKKIEKEIGKPIGSGYPSDPITISFLEDWIKTNKATPPHTRQSWETVERIVKQAMAPTKSLDQFSGKQGASQNGNGKGKA